MQMTTQGSRIWAKMTTDNVNRPLAIVLDDVVYSAPNVNGPIEGGEVIERKYRKDLNSFIKQCTRRANILEWNVPLANMNGIYASDAGNILAENEPFAAIYYDTDKHRVFSLGSRENGLDVSEIASKFNGGGHKRAAGFKVDRDHPLAKI